MTYSHQNVPVIGCVTDTSCISMHQVALCTCLVHNLLSLCKTLATNQLLFIYQRVRKVNLICSEKNTMHRVTSAEATKAMMVVDSLYYRIIE